MRKLVAAASLAALAASAAPAAAQPGIAVREPAASGVAAAPVARDGVTRVKPVVRLRAARAAGAVRGYFEG
jgi:hypothetical protein